MTEKCFNYYLLCNASFVKVLMKFFDLIIFWRFFLCEFENILIIISSTNQVNYKMIMLNVTCYGIHKFSESILSPQLEEKLTLITKSIFLKYPVDT